jgi:hypothetical protein
MKKTVLILILVIITTLTYSQKQLVGINRGIVFSNISTDMDWVNDRTYKTDWSTNINYENFLSKNISIEIGINYTKKGFIDYFVWTDEYGNEIGKDEYTTSYEYLSIPIGAKYTIGNKLKGIGIIGISPAYLIKGTTIIPDYIEIYNHEKDITKYPNRFDLNAFIGIGISYEILKRFEININGIFNHSLISMTNKDYFENNKIYNYFYNMNIGLKYYLKNE